MVRFFLKTLKMKILCLVIISSHCSLGPLIGHHMILPITNHNVPWLQPPLIGHHVLSLVFMSFNYRAACSIPLADHVVITGEADTLTTVSKYNKEGWQSDMPSLNQGRRNHGCTSFNTRGQQVRQI